MIDRKGFVDHLNNLISWNANRKGVAWFNVYEFGPKFGYKDIDRLKSNTLRDFRKAGYDVISNRGGSGFGVKFNGH